MTYLYLLFFSLSVFSRELPPLACSEKVQSFIKEWKATGQWQEEKTVGLRSSFFASPTNVIGEWVLVRKIPEGTVISRSRDSGRIEVVLDEKKCAQKVKSYSHKKSVGFTDRDLAKFVTKNKTGVIYVWSPRMDLSVKGISEMKAAAKKKRLPLLILLDKDVSSAEKSKLEKSLGKDAVKTVDSFELKMRHAQLHFPAIFVFKNQKILSEVKYGYEKADRYELDLDKFLGTGKRL